MLSWFDKNNLQKIIRNILNCVLANREKKNNFKIKIFIYLDVESPNVVMRLMLKMFAELLDIAFKMSRYFY